MNDHEESIFHDAAEIRSEAERRAYLDRACGDDQSLRASVEALLSASARSGDLLDVTQQHVPAVDRSGSSDRPGSLIGPYKLLQEIGEGGMGVVYMAEQSQPVKRRVALKIIKPGMDSRQIIARFEAEQQALAMMEHPNVARVLDAGTTNNGRPYFAMELVKGIPITKYCDTNHLTNRQRLELFADVCHAVQHAHHKGIIHRDLKPSNVLVAEYDDQPVPKVIDFGVAKALNQSLTDKTMFTQYGQIVGTIEYMSPEQAKFNQLDVDTRSDIYSLGVLLYELLTGNTPFDKDRLRSTGFDELMRIIGEEDPPRPSTRLHSSETLAALAANRSTEAKKLAGLVRGELDWIVMRAMEKDRTRRYETASALAADVQRYLNDEPVEACPPSVSYRLQKFMRRNRTVLSRTAAAVAFICLATLAATFGWKYFSGQDQLALQQSEAQHRQQAFEQQRQREQQAREEGIPRLRTFIEEKKYVEALALSTELEEVLSGDPTVAELRKEFAHDVAVQTFPDGSDAYWRDYDNPRHAWQYAGRTPIDSISLPLEAVLWKVSREGFDEVLGYRNESEDLIQFTLDKIGEAPEGMVRVAGNAYKPNIYRISLDDIELDDYYIDRFEVTNRQFKEFVDAGGYEKREYWDTEFERGLDVLAWDDVADRFVDEDGSPGPLTWRNGSYPEGEDDFPVRGVSWYEARAYARFVSKELPTVVHWLRARGDGWQNLREIAGQSHIGSDDPGPVAVGSRYGIGPFGTHDMAGNVAEWCFNSGDKPVIEGDQPQRILVGASWNDIAYKSEQADFRPPLDRSPTIGFRCAKYSVSAVPQEALASIIRNAARDLIGETPINDEMFELCQGIYTSYLSKNPQLKATENLCKETERYRHEKVEINTGYDDQRLALHLLLPKNDDRRFQPVLFFPGVGHFKLRYPFPEQPLPESQSGDVYQELNEQTGLAAVWDELLFLVDSGRAVVFPVYEGSFDRRPISSEYQIHHFLDLVRAIDYLEIRPEMDTSRIGYLGTSWGAIKGNHFLAMEKRIAAAILYHGGLANDKTPQPQYDAINFAPRVTTPTLMINAANDNIILLQGEAKPMFHFLGTPAEDKAWIVHKGWHMKNYTSPSPVWREDALAWLDKYLGPFDQQSDYERLSAPAHFAVASGNWPVAADYYTQLTRAEATKAESSTAKQRTQFEGFAWNWAAAALLMAGDDAGYQQLCNRMVEQFAGREEPWIRERVLKTCCLRPDVVDVSAFDVDATILALDQGEVPKAFRRWTSVACALEKLRSGDADHALTLAGRAVEGGTRNKMLQAMSHAIQSLANQELGKTQQAQTALDDAAELIDENLPKGDDGKVNPHFAMHGQKLRHDWIFAELLRREAEELIAAPATSAQ